MTEPVDETAALPDSSKKTKQRNKHSLPPELSNLTIRDRDKFVLVVEIDKTPRSVTLGQEFLVAQSVRIPGITLDPNLPPCPILFNLCVLTVDNLRNLCTCLGILNAGSLSKFNCRKAIATYCRYQESLDRTGLRPTAHAARITSSVCRAVNVVFSVDFIEEFKTVNDRKGRKDHETQNTFKAFWIRAVAAHNACMETESEIVLVEKATSPARRDGSVAETPVACTARVNLFPDSEASDDSSIVGGEALVVNTGGDNDDAVVMRSVDEFDTIVVFPVDDEHLLELVSDLDVDLSNVDQYSTKVFQKKIMDLFKVRRKMKTNMTVSGTHDSDPWHFVENAMLGSSGLNKISAYYFYQRCEANHDIDSNFQPFMDSAMKGDSVSEWGVDDDDSQAASGSRKRDRAKEAESTSATILEKIYDRGGKLMSHLEKVERLNKKKTTFHARLEVAKALGDKDELQRLMVEAQTLGED